MSGETLPYTTATPLLGSGWTVLEFEHFRPGIAIHHLVRGEPALALLKYEPGTRIPLHRHAGMETIFVLSGSQSDENGTYVTGDLVINPENSVHSVWSDEGCVVLLQWTRPVEFIDEFESQND